MESSWPKEGAETLRVAAPRWLFWPDPLYPGLVWAGALGSLVGGSLEFNSDGW